MTYVELHIKRRVTLKNLLPSHVSHVYETGRNRTVIFVHTDFRNSSTSQININLVSNRYVDWIMEMMRNSVKYTIPTTVS